MFRKHTHTFPDVTTFNIVLTRPSTVDMEVFDQAGRRVWATHLEDAVEGPRTIMFGGRDRYGHPFPDGTYIYRVSVDGSTITRKIKIAR